MEDIKNILVTGGGAPGAPGIIKALHSSKYKIFSCDNRSSTIGSLLAQHSFTVPFGDDPAYITQLLKQALDNKINTILPITTRELLPLAQNKKLFEDKGIEVIISPEESIELANNKGSLMEHLNKNNVPTAKFQVCHTIEEFEGAAYQLGYPEKAITFKPTTSNGSRGFRIIDPTINEHHLLFYEKPSNTYITYSKAIEILSRKSFPELVVMEYLPGDEYSVDCLIKEGRIQYIIPRKRTQMRAGISVEGEITNNLEIIDYCKRILKLIPLHGPIGIQVKLDQLNTPKILEINPRIQGTSVACIGAGVNLALSAIDGLDVTNMNQGVKWGTKFIRYYSEAFYT